MNNFIVGLDLHCAPRYKIGLMGTFIFLGFLVGAMIFPRLADIHGRKPIFRTYFLLHIVAIGTILFAPSLYFVYFGFLLLGLGSTVRTSVAFVHCLELMEIKYQNIVATIIKTIDCSSPILFVVLL
jgi:MFS family permease